MNLWKKAFCFILIFAFLLPMIPAEIFAAGDEIVLRVSNWEEYIDEGDWGEDEVIDLESGDIFGENPVIEDFEEWYYETYGKKVRVEYSTFGTNEDLYNMLTLGDVFDLVCPSEYMIMKLIAEGRAYPLSQHFFDTSDPNNYYSIGVSPFIRDIFDSHTIDGHTWSEYAAGYMWGVTGFVYNPEIVSKEDASTWHLMENPDYFRQVTMKDNVRDSYFAAVGAVESDLLMSESFRSDPDYRTKLEEVMNNTSQEEVDKIQEYLQLVRGNCYAFETDSGKGDMVTGKVAANVQWSGDAVYAMDQAEEDDCYLSFCVPEEVTNIYFDGWIMLRCGVEGDPDRQHAAEAFLNFLSRPDIVVRDMYYIGYTSVISNNDDGRIYEYLEWNYSADGDEEETTEYSVAHFFTDDETEAENFILTTTPDQLDRQLAAQYPSEDILERSSIMRYFDADVSIRTNLMWTNIRCYNVHDVPVWAWILAALIVAAFLFFFVRAKLKQRGDVDVLENLRGKLKRTN